MSLHKSVCIASKRQHSTADREITYLSVVFTNDGRRKKQLVTWIGKTKSIT